MAKSLVWYDAVWLNHYLAAKDVIAAAAPQRLEEFVRAFDVLRTEPDFRVKDVRGVFDETMLARIKATIKSIPMEEMELHEMKQFGRFVVHNHPVFTELQAKLTDRVSELAGEAVEPFYNFLSLYTRMGICEPHLDAPSAKWTLDVCIDQSEPWPIHFSQVVPWPETRVALGEDWQAKIKSSPDLKFEAKVLTPGNAILFSGSGQWHYRDAIPRRGSKGHCDLLFFHFIPKGAGKIVHPGNWAEIFGIPEIGEIPEIETAA